ncbi:MAG TPA: lyase family protein, partial [Candidatus Dormibacteraeota bacterium]|nr:lyase family protein [Candidatus Dormibacteraeota bacterium]
MGHGRAHLGSGAGAASRARLRPAARRREEADAIARKLWGGRFERGLHPELERFSSSLAVDFELYPYDIAGSIAHARGLQAGGVLSAPQVAAIERGLKRIRRELDDGSFKFVSSDEDIHTAIERRLTELTPHGARLHAGRSRNDQVALDLRLYCRDAAQEAIELLAQLIDALAINAAAHADWLMPGYTHMQRAQPITAGYHLLAHAEPLVRDSRR